MFDEQSVVGKNLKMNGNVLEKQYSPDTATEIHNHRLDSIVGYGKKKLGVLVCVSVHLCVFISVCNP